jgi:hypothetical protein
MTTQYLSFDIETAKVTPEGEDVQLHRPLGISCWAVAWVDGRDVVVSHSFSGTDAEGGITPQLTREECIALVWRLHRAVERGFTILTHNGAGFDFDILAEESGMHSLCAHLALHSVDTCFLVHCLKGFPVGLDAIARGMGLSGKAEGMSGALAPQMWAEGKFQEVLAYVEQDVRATLNVALEIEKLRLLAWISRSGKRNILLVPQLLTVEEALRLPEPNTSWMSDPLPRSRFVGWMEMANDGVPAR